MTNSSWHKIIFNSEDDFLNWLNEDGLNTPEEYNYLRSPDGPPFILIAPGTPATAILVFYLK